MPSATVLNGTELPGVVIDDCCAVITLLRFKGVVAFILREFKRLWFTRSIERTNNTLCFEMVGKLTYNGSRWLE